MDEVAKRAAKVRRGKNRARVFKEIDGMRTSSEIAKAAFGSKSETMLSITSRALKELSEERLASCINPEEKTGRVYKLTSSGLKVKEAMERYS